MYTGKPFDGEHLGIFDDLAMQDKLSTALTVSDPVDLGNGAYKLFAEYSDTLVMYIIDKIEVQA